MSFFRLMLSNRGRGRAEAKARAYADAAGVQPVDWTDWRAYDGDIPAFIEGLCWLTATGA